MAPDQLAQLVGSERLLDGAQQGQAVGLGHRRDRCEQLALECAGEYQRDAGPGLPQVASEFHAVHARHLEVADDDVDRARRILDHVEGGAPIGGFVYRLRAESCEHADDELALKFMVFSDQKSQAGE